MLEINSPDDEDDFQKAISIPKMMLTSMQNFNQQKSKWIRKERKLNKN